MDRPAGLSRRKIVYALILIVGGFAGLLAAYSLTMDAIEIAKDPSASLTCNVNATVQCASNIGSWQGKVFGPPNPILGLMMFPAPIVVGFALLAGARFKAWFWWIFTAGMWFAAIFVFWLAFESIFTIRTLCPWCALTYLAVLPMWSADDGAPAFRVCRSRCEARRRAARHGSADPAPGLRPHPHLRSRRDAPRRPYQPPLLRSWPRGLPKSGARAGHVVGTRTKSGRLKPWSVPDADGVIARELRHAR